jgi:antitoxin VapB
MGLNIKNQEAHRLAKKLAGLTGESMTTAVTEAIRERLDRIGHAKGVCLADRLVAIGKRTAKHLRGSARTVDHSDPLYDKRGLPR